MSRTLPTSARALLAALETEDSLSMEVSRHSTYLELSYFADTRNDAALQADASFRSTPLGAFASAVGGLPPSTIRGLQAAEPRLARYAFAIASNRPDSTRSLTPGGERVYAALAPLATGWGPQVSSEMLAATDFGTVQTLAG